MRAQELREEMAEKERGEHFNTIQPVIQMKQEWRVKEKTSVCALTASDDDIDLLDNDESLLIKDGFHHRLHVHEHGVHATDRVQGCRVVGCSDVSRPQGGQVREA
jgi:hypothetical protein